MDNYIGEGSFSKLSIPAGSNREKEAYITVYYSNVANAVVNAITHREFVLSVRGTAEANILFGLITFSQDFQATKSYS